MHINWRDRIKVYKDKAVLENVIETNVDLGRQATYLGLQIFFDKNNSSIFLEKTKNSLPIDLQRKIYWQDASSLHMTIQSTLVNDQLISEDILKQLSISLRNEVHQTKFDLTNFVYPIFSQTGIIGIFDCQDFIYRLRESVSKIWQKYGLEIAVKEDIWNFPYSFLGRFTKQLSPVEIELLLKLPEEQTKVTITNLKLCLSDKFISPDTVKIISNFPI